MRIILSSLMIGFLLVLVACGPATAPAPTADPMAGMDMGGEAGEEYDLSFIDGMIGHHEGAIVMAQQALAEAERPEIRQLAEEIIAAQQAEIDQMEEWRASWYPEAAPIADMGDMDMGDMAMGVPAGDTPFEQRFIEAMIPHHQDAVVMAQEALSMAEHQEIKDLSAAIISAQEAEITQMQAWLAEWYGL